MDCSKVIRDLTGLIGELRPHNVIMSYEMPEMVSRLRLEDVAVSDEQIQSVRLPPSNPTQCWKPAAGYRISSPWTGRCLS